MSTKFKVAVIGSGGREHAIVWKLSQSPMVEKLFAVPGNGGTSGLAESVKLDVADVWGILDFCKNEKIDLVVVGPEKPLSVGLVDILRQNNIAVVGPSKQAAMLEASKIFAKEIMIRSGIPTANFKIAQSKSEIFSMVDEFGFPFVIKMDGLCAGKGVFICKDMQELEQAVQAVYGNSDTGEKVLIEKFLKGEEASYMIITDGESCVPLATSRDHKKIYEGEKGPNTGGMGAVSPAPIDADIEKKVEEIVVKPLINGLKKEKLPYNGVIYAGLMILPDGGIRVLEFNARLGDPETQAILFKLDSDLMEILLPLGRDNRLPKGASLKWKKGISCCVVLASQGYPGKYSKNDCIERLSDGLNSEDAYVFHAGTVKKDGKYYSDGGRVLGVTAIGNTLEEARKKAYNLVDKVKWQKSYFRKDIGVWR
jgi:phosphoribosylamine---glycine ligase